MSGGQAWGSKAPKVLGLTSAAVIALDVRSAPAFKLTPGVALQINASDGGKPLEELTFFIDTVGASSYVVTFGTNFRSTGTLATGTVTLQRFVLRFVSDGIVWSEVSRTAVQP